MRKTFIILATALACLTARAQTPEFMKLYASAIAALDGSDAGGSGKTGGGIVTSEFSGRMLRTLMPKKSEDKAHMVNRIDMIRQIKFTPQSGSDLFRRLRELAESERYERLSIMNVDEESVYIYTAPDKDSGSEFLILIVKGGSRLACDIVGDVTLKDVLDLIMGQG